MGKVGGLMSSLSRAAASPGDDIEYVDLDSITQTVAIRRADGTVVHPDPPPVDSAGKGKGMALISIVVVLAVIVVTLGALGLFVKHQSDQEIAAYKASGQRATASSAHQRISFSYPTDWKDSSATLSATTSRVQKDAVPNGEIVGFAGVTLLEKTADPAVETPASAGQAVTAWAQQLQTKTSQPDLAVTQCQAESVELTGQPRPIITTNAAAVVVAFTCKGNDGTPRQAWQMRGYFPGPLASAEARVPGRMFTLTFHGQQRYWKINKGLLDELASSVRLDGQPI